MGQPHEGVTVIAGLIIPSNSPTFLGLVAAHAFFALLAVIAGATAMLSPKVPGRHPIFGTTYYWSLGAAVAIALVLSGMRWLEDWPLALLGVLAFLAATVAREARRGRWRGWTPLHIGGMATSYILVLTAFYVDNGKNLPIWRDLPPIAYWLAPTVIGAPITAWALRRRTRSLV